MKSAMTPIERLHLLEQSVWYDNIERRLLKNGYLEKMVAADLIRGVTSNPSIFNNAISKSGDYDDELIPLAKAGKDQWEIYEALVISDIQEACDLFQPLYETSHGGDGFVSLEVSPYLARDTEKTIEDVKRLWGKVNRPNLMVKIPGTVEGLAAITQAISAGININVTLIFSVQRYKQVMDAYLNGLETRVRLGEQIDKIASVASFFVSRIDTNVDNRVEKLLKLGVISPTQAKSVQGRIAVANAKLAYELHKEVFSGERYRRLEDHDSQIQRPLWASTSTKNPEYQDTKYVEELIGPNTVNTIPPQTLEAFQDHGRVALTLEADLVSSREAMQTLEEIGIQINEVTDELEDQGVQSFSDAFTDLLKTIESRRISAKS